MRGCRPDEESYETERGSKYCKPMLGGGTRCFCKTEYCNGADLDKHLREFESGGGDQGGGDQTGTTPTSSAVAWRLSGVALSVGLILVKTIFML